MVRARELDALELQRGPRILGVIVSAQPYRKDTEEILS